MFSPPSSPFSTNNPFKSRFAGDAFDSEDPVARGTGEYVKARGSSFAGGEADTASAGVSSDKAASFGNSGDGPFGDFTTTYAPGVSVGTKPAQEEGAVTSQPVGPDATREQRWGQATGEVWDTKRGSELEGDVLDKKEVWSKIKKGGMSAEELDSWASDNNVKMNAKGQAFLDAKLGRISSGAEKGTGNGSGSTDGGDTETVVDGGGGGDETGSGGNEGGVTDTEGQNAQKGANRFKYRTGNYTHQARDYGAISSRIANEAHDRAAAMRGDELLELRKQIDKQPLYWKARSDVQTGDYLGDIWNFDIGDFKMPKPMSPVEKPDIAGIADDYMDRIDSIKPKL